ncbi:MAG: hypothetical protein KME18_17970 [Phormidium tanganyikae FI6-MK23]|nr:hypothetical protein [Phormidium tanganyikae FI6-MK23]
MVAIALEQVATFLVSGGDSSVEAGHDFGRDVLRHLFRHRLIVARTQPIDEPQELLPKFHQSKFLLLRPARSHLEVE